MKTIAMPSLLQLPQTSKSCATSCWSRLDVGSSRISTSRARCRVARAIATICWTAIE